MVLPLLLLLWLTPCVVLATNIAGPVYTPIYPPQVTGKNALKKPQSNVGSHGHFSLVDSVGSSLVDSVKLRNEVHVEGLMEHLSVWERFALESPAGNRVVGTVGHDRTLTYIQKHLAALAGYYDIEMQKFEQTLIPAGSATMYLNGQGSFGFAITYSKPALYRGEVVVVENWGCRQSDYPKDVRGKIVLGIAGKRAFLCTAEVIATAAQTMGALAVILAPGNHHRRGGCQQGQDIPASGDQFPIVMVYQWEIARLRKAIATGEKVEVDVAVKDLPCRHVRSYNIIATSKIGNVSETLLLGAHSDSVAAGPGINDNGSGSAALLELAILMAKYKTKSRIRFAWWTAEESGLLGSKQYVEQASDKELENTLLYLNFDMIASPNFKIGSYDGDGRAFGKKGPLGSEHTQRLFDDFFHSAGFNTSASEFDGRSDYGPFIAAGIPAGGTATGADGVKTEAEAQMFGGIVGEAYDKNYHLAGDNMANVNRTAFLINAKAIAHVLAHYARSFDGFPRRSPHVPPRAAIQMPIVVGGACGGHLYDDLELDHEHFE